MISFKKAVLALGIGIGMSAAMTSWAAPGCEACLGMAQQCEAGNQTSCANFDRLGCARFGVPGAISCDF